MSRLAIIISLFALASCSGAGTTRPDGDSPYRAEAIERGHADALKAIEAPKGSMAQENAILEIHARAHRLELTGDSAAARIYLEAATAALDSAGIFTE